MGKGWLDTYKEGGKLPKKQSTNEVPTRNYIPELPPLDPAFVNWSQVPQNYMQDAKKLPKASWQDKTRAGIQKLAHTELNGQMSNNSNNYVDLLSAPIQAGINLSEPSKSYPSNPNNPWYDRIINTAAPMMMDVGQVAMFAPESYASRMKNFATSVEADIQGPNAYSTGELSGTRPWPERPVQPQRNMLERGVIAADNAIKNEVYAIPRVINQAKNLKRTIIPTAPIATEEANLLKNTRLVGSITHGGGEESVRLQNILNRAQTMSDRDLKALTGMSKQEIQERIDIVKNSNIPEKKQGSINLQRSGDIGSDNDLINRMQGEHENLQNRMIREAETSLREQGLFNRLQDPPQELNIDIRNTGWDTYNTSNLTEPSFNWNHINNKVPIVEKIYNKWAANRTKDFLPQTSMPVTQALIPGLAKSASNNPAAEMLNAYKKVENAPKGITFIPAHSLSADSYPMSMRLMKKGQEAGIGDINYHGHNSLNTLGFPEKAGIDPNIILREQNTLIEQMNKSRSKKIPYGYIENDQVYVPQVTMTRKKYGGKVNNWLDTYKK